MEHAQMEMSPAAMLEAAMDGTLNVDGEQPATTTTDDHKSPVAEQAPVVVEEEGKAVEAKPAEAKTEEAKPASEEKEPEGAPIASKSGAYTIPYQKLVDARQERDDLKQKVAELEGKVQSLSTQQQVNLAQAQESAQARADAGAAPTQADQNLNAAQDAIDHGVDASVFGDFSEEAIAKGIQVLQAQARDQLRAEMRAEVKAELAKELAPLKAKEDERAGNEHMSSIYKAHPDADEVAESGEFKAWRDAMPSFMRAGVDHALAEGTSKEVIEVFDSFKARGGKQEAKPSATETPKVPEVPRRVPTSLSEMAGAAPVDEVQQTLQLAGNPGALLERMASMKPEQIDALMNRV